MQTESQPTSSSGTPSQISYREAVCAALEDELTDDPNVVLMGEDIAEAGGVFKTTEGLVERFGRDRVRNTPICENGFMGVALGMALTGFRPVVEIMFSDFLPMAGDAIVNELAKFRFMSGGKSPVPVTIRSIAGATGRLGTQHSASGESWYMQFPGLKVATASSPGAAYRTLRACIRDNNPTIFYEHRGLYNSKGHVVRGKVANGNVGRAQVLRPGADITVVGTMLMAVRALKAANQIHGEGIDAEVIDLCWLRPIDTNTIETSVRKTGRLVIVEEQVHAGGWGATIISQLAIRGIPLSRPPIAVSLPDNVLIPYSPQLEDAVVPSVERITQAIRSAVM
jgi:pyruvate dehydrogenase E1 component beta subunit